jgi:hypothetical protein
MFKIFTIIPLLFLLSSCEDIKKSSIDRNKDIDSNKREANFMTEATHFVKIECGGKSIPLRNRILGSNELILSQLNTNDSKKLNDTTIIEYLENGDRVKLLRNDSSGYYYVEVINQLISGRGYRADLNYFETKKGYIIAKYCKEPTIKEILKINVPHIKSTNANIELLEHLKKYCGNQEILSNVYAYADEEGGFYQMLSFDVASVSEIYYKVNTVELQDRQYYFNGVATLLDKYEYKNGMIFFRFSCQEINGHEMELHISNNYQVAFFVVKGNYDFGSSLSVLGANEINTESFNEDIIMNRIK